VQLEQRLESAFEQAGMFFSSYGVFLPWLDRPQFYALLSKGTVLLDTIGFSGFNTAMQAIECGLPIVTRDGKFMRGRLASGILKRMGMQEYVAKDDQQYVDMAVNIASDTLYRETVRHRIETSRGVLFNDLAPIRAFEHFLTHICEKTSHGDLRLQQAGVR
jgi:predicted O-linked N-acetylglucosamine transferase (SPINDLY family)